ncbi:MAG: LssY C-terminal domain-containing protein [Pseudomonadota bacterium]|nr:LssY C-terminal domain-containing protein [Pseudomonadota bacterium]
MRTGKPAVERDPGRGRRSGRWCSRLDRGRRSGRGPGALRLIVLLGSALLLASCATRYQKPDPFDDTALRARVKTVAEDGIQVSAVIPNRAEIEAIFGADLTKKNIQPLWLEIRNDTDRQIFFLPTGLDPEYFSPLEVAFGFHKPYSKEGRAEFDRYIESTGMQLRIDPHTTESGFIFTNPDQDSKLVNVDLFGLKWTKSIALVVPTPDRDVPDSYYERLVRTREGLVFEDVQDEARLRELLEQLPCCVTARDGSRGEPLNLVMVGSLTDIGSSLIRRSYRVAPAAPWYLFGRVQDVSLNKQDTWVAAQPHTVRAWLTDIRFQGKTVWIGSVTMPLGGRFAGGSGNDAGPRLDPNIDEARNDLVQDMIYSQHLGRLGFARGVGRVTTSKPRATQGGGTYHTDGLRAVLLFEHDPVSISEIGNLGWERLVDHYRTQIDRGDGAPPGKTP